MSVIQNFVHSQNIPDFVKQDHELFDTFISAYYEWLEKEATGTNTSLRDLYLAIGRPGYVVTNQQILVDIDETIPEFLEFFTNQVLPFPIDNIKSDPAFFLKHIRDIYLAKGSPRSYKLLFRMLFNEDIDLSETGTLTLKASGGEYLQQSTSHFLVTGFEEQINNIDFYLSSLNDSDGNFVASVLNAIIINRYGDDNKPVLRVQFAGLPTINTKQFYSIVDAKSKSLSIKVQPLLSLNTVTVTNPGALYSANDSIIFKSKSLDKSFDVSVSSVKSGRVDYLSVRDRGSFYNVGDTITFTGTNGSGGFATVTEVGPGGKITGIDGNNVKSGEFQQGYESSNFTRILSPITNGGIWRTLPKTSLSLTTNEGYALPYGGTNATAGGLQVQPVSTSIGAIGDVEFSEVGYFLDDNDIEVIVPANLVIDSPEGLNDGSVITFSTFKSATGSSEAFKDDSETILLTISVAKDFTIDQISSAALSLKIRIPYDYDQEGGVWLDSEFVFTQDENSFNDVVDKIKALTEFDVKTTYAVDADKSLIDGGPTLDFTSAGFYDGGSAFSTVATGTEIDGGDDFNFGGSITFDATIEYSNEKVSGLEQAQFDNLNYFVMSENGVSVDYSIQTSNVKYGISGDIGSWVSSGFYAKINKFNPLTNVCSVVQYDDKLFPSEADFSKLFSEKYNAVKISLVDVNENEESNFYLPLNNIVVHYSQAAISYSLNGVSSTSKTFVNENGFLSSQSSGVLQDNKFFSEHTYNIKSTVSVDGWRAKVKQLVHPAGKIMIADLDVSQSQIAQLDAVVTGSFIGESGKMSFDASQEFYQSASNVYSINADNTYYKTNAFEYDNNTNTGTTLTADYYKNLGNIATQSQTGNSWWDYEPVGLVGSTSTQDSDGVGFIANTTRIYKPFDGSKQDFYKTNRRTNIRTPIVKTSFYDTFNENYSAYVAAELPTNFFATFSDSDVGFSAIDYSLITNTALTKKTTKVDRKSELTIAAEKDFNQAMKEDGSFTFTDTSGTYTDFTAFDRKWNYVNTNRTINTQGWSVVGFSSSVQNATENVKSRRAKQSAFRTTPLFTTTKTPLNQQVWGSSKTWVWNEAYDGGINTSITVDTTVNEEQTTSFNRDPRVLMRGRRGG